MKINETDIKKSYSSSGYVLGNYWGGGKGAYPARQFLADSEEELIKLNEDALKDGSLDSGMGYSSLIGAYLLIRETKSFMYNEEEFKSFNFYPITIGELSDKEIEFLEEITI